MAVKFEDKTVIGWSEYTDLPDWDIRNMRVKVDTGARTSALHVENLELSEDGEWARFEVVLSRKHPDRRQTVRARVHKWARVRSSTGIYKRRCFVRTRIRIGPVEKEIDISLVSRERMIYRMLLGRKALEHDFVVDVSRHRVLGKNRSPKRVRKVVSRRAVAPQSRKKK